jgi:copper chaperone
MEQHEYRVTGMTCDHCVRAVQSEVSAVVGVERVDVDLAGQRVTVAGVDIEDDAVRTAIADAGYEAA